MLPSNPSRPRATTRLGAWLHFQLRQWSARRLAWLNPDLVSLRWAPEGIVRCNNVFTAEPGAFLPWHQTGIRPRVRFLPPPLHAHVGETHPGIIKSAVK